MVGVCVGRIKITDRGLEIRLLSFTADPRDAAFGIRFGRRQVEKGRVVTDAVEPVSLLAAVGKAVPALSPATIGQ